MADVKITALPAAASVLATDIFPVVADPGGTPATKKATFAVLSTLLSATYATIATPALTGTATITDGATDPTFLVKSGSFSGGSLTQNSSSGVVILAVLDATKTLRLLPGSTSGVAQLGFCSVGTGGVGTYTSIAYTILYGNIGAEADGTRSIGTDETGAFVSGNRPKNIAITGMVVSGYQYSAPIAGATVTVTAGLISKLVLNPAGTLATLTVTLPATPADGQTCRVGCSQIVTTLTLNAPGGATVSNSPAAFAAGGSCEFLYRTADTTWYRIG